jgi:hypothetical protein
VNNLAAKEEPDTATKYRNQSIAEQRSIDLAWDLLMKPCYEQLRECMFPTESEFKHFRQLIVNSVLARTCPYSRSYQDLQFRAE